MSKGEVMKKQLGLTLIEAMIDLAFVGIVLTVILNGAAALTNGSSLSFGANGITEVRCVDGYRFVIGAGGQARQVLDEFGKGAKC